MMVGYGDVSVNSLCQCGAMRLRGRIADHRVQSQLLLGVVIQVLVEKVYLVGITG